MTFTQLTARLKNFLRGWLLVLGLKEGLVKCVTVCVKSEVILDHISAVAYKTETKTFQRFICSKVRTLQIYTQNGLKIKMNLIPTLEHSV